MKSKPAASTHSTPQSAKVPPKIALFTPSEKRLGNHRFLDPPQPSELSWRLHKTSIFTCWPCPQNGIEMTSQNLHFGYLWAPKSPTVTTRSVSENALKKHLQKIKTKYQNDLQKCLPSSPGNALFYGSGSRPGLNGAQTTNIFHFSSKMFNFSMKTSLFQGLFALALA